MIRMSRFGYAITSQPGIYQVKGLTEHPAKPGQGKPAPIRSTDEIRVFFAIWPTHGIQQRLHAVAKTHQAACNGRIMRTETLHMTLQFIGNIRRRQLAQLIKAADQVSGIAPFRFELDKLAYWKHNRIAYAALSRDEPALDAIAMKLQQALAAEGVVFESARFSPHVTLLRNAAHIQAAQTITAIPWQVNSFVLVESVLSNHGAHYRILKEWPLSA